MALFCWGSISFVELLILYERWAGERLRVETSIPKFSGPGGPSSVSAAPLCPDAVIWKLCPCCGCMLRALRRLSGGLGRFVPGRIGANHRLRHLEIWIHRLEIMREHGRVPSPSPHHPPPTHPYTHSPTPPPGLRLEHGLVGHHFVSSAASSREPV